MIRHFDAAEAALPDETLIGLTLPALIRLLAWREPFLVPQNLRAVIPIELICATIAVAEERGSAAFEMIACQLLPSQAFLQRLRFQRALFVDEIGTRIAAAHRDEPVEHRFRVGARTVPPDRPNDRPCIRAREALIQIQVPHEIGLRVA